MSRERYRHTVWILRRVAGGGAGGYALDEYARIAQTSCEVRDESETEYAAAESARLEHVKTFSMRERDVKDDDLILWRGDAYRVRRVDRYTHNGREIRVRAAYSASRYTIAADTEAGDGEA